MPLRTYITHCCMTCMPQQTPTLLSLVNVTLNSIIIQSNNSTIPELAASVNACITLCRGEQNKQKAVKTMKRGLATCRCQQHTVILHTSVCLDGSCMTQSTSPPFLHICCTQRNPTLSSHTVHSKTNITHSSCKPNVKYLLRLS